MCGSKPWAYLERRAHTRLVREDELPLDDVVKRLLTPRPSERRSAERQLMQQNAERPPVNRRTYTNRAADSSVHQANRQWQQAM